MGKINKKQFQTKIVDSRFLQNASVVFNNSFISDLKKIKDKIKHRTTAFGDSITYSSKYDNISRQNENSSFYYMYSPVECHYTVNDLYNLQFKTNTKIDTNNFYLASFYLKYNFLDKKYENYVKKQNYENLLDIYSMNEYVIEREALEKINIDVRELLKKYSSGFLEPIPSQQLKIYDLEYKINQIDDFSYKPIKNLYKDDIYKFINSSNRFKVLFPFYGIIKFDLINHYKNNFSQLFNNFNVTKKIFDILNKLEGENIAKSGSRFYLDNNIFSDIITSFDSDFIRNYNNLAKEFFKIKNLKDIIYDIQGYSEIIGWRFRKFDSKNNLLEVKYFPRKTNFSDSIFSDNQTFLEIIDTKVKYSEEYLYVLDNIVYIETPRITYGSKSSTIMRDDVIDPNAEYIVDHTYILNSKASIGFVTSAFYRNRLLSNPPLPPEPEFIPYVGLKDKFKLILRSAAGQVDEIPLTMNEEEATLAETLIKSQNRLLGHPLRFRSDDTISQIQIFKTTKKPKNINDILKIENLIEINTNEYSSVSLEEYIQPNVKYYYAFRSKDYHGLFSNPSQVWSAEIQNDNGTLFPLFSLEDLNTVDTSVEKTKQFKKYLSIAPSSRNILFDDDKRESYENSSLQSIFNKLKPGLGDNLVWGKKFKIVLTSKSTGRKIEFYLQYNFDKKLITTNGNSNNNNNNRTNNRNNNWYSNENISINMFGQSKELNY